MSADLKSMPRGRLVERLGREGHRFGFFQAVRLLELMRYAAHEVKGGEAAAIGADGPAEAEGVRFRAAVSNSFPAGSVAELKLPADPGAARAEMVIGFMGLVGPQGTMPQHYTALVIERLHVRFKDPSLREFLDIFHHRIVSLFYRAWQKYRLPFAHERSARFDETDAFGSVLDCLVGLGTPWLRGRLSFQESAVRYFAGHFAHRPRTLTALEQMLSSYFSLPVKVEPLVGQWLRLSEEEQTSFPSLQLRTGLNTQLGVNTIAGERYWCIESKFRVVMGPLSYKQFLRLMPSGPAYRALCDFVRLYAGPEYDFNILLVLAAPQVPYCQMTAGKDDSPRLGWNTWSHNQPFAVDARDAEFEARDWG